MIPRTGRLAGLAATAALLVPVPARADTAVAMQRSRYEPAQVSVPAGTTVVWTNNDGVGHSVTADDESFDSNPSCGSLGGTCMNGGQTYRTTFFAPGTFPYHCRVHGGPGGRGMAGTVTVT